MRSSRAWLLLAALLLNPLAASANVITDWDEKAVALIQPRMTPPVAYRAMAIVHLAMFEAVNSIEPRYRAYKSTLPATPTVSKEAAAATAAGVALSKLVPDLAVDIKAAMTNYLAALPDGTDKADGIKLGTEAAEAIVAARANDGSAAADSYRPVTTAGVYVPTSVMVAPQWPNLTPFAMTSATQFRPEPPIALDSEQWARDYNEIRELGSKTSNKRTARQTEDARFWLLTGPLATHPLQCQIAIARHMSVVDSARFMATIAVAEADAMIVLMDAKYKYAFWRPVTAIRNGDIDGNATTERDAAWQPIDNTPMHPEYPCAHCLVSSTVAAAIEAMLGTADVGEITMVSPMAPGATHRWSNLYAYADEVAAARIYAGFHYRFSTQVGQRVGRAVGAYVVNTVLRPLN